MMPIKILLCEDEKPIQTIFRVTVETRGHTVDAASDVTEAMAFFSSRADANFYDLIVIDVNMPGPSGFSMAGFARGAGYNGRLAMFTNNEPEMSNMAMVEAEYWPKIDAMGNLIERVEWKASE